MFDLNEYSHTRLNSFTGDWILISPHPMKSPWHGKAEDLHRPMIPNVIYVPAIKERTERIIPVTQNLTHSSMISQPY